MRVCENCKEAIEGKICYVNKMGVCKKCFYKILLEKRKKRKMFLK